MSEKKRPFFHVDPLLLSAVLPAAVFGYFLPLCAGLVAIMLHEGSHLVAARLFGVRTQRISLTPFGGLAQMQNAPTAKAAFFIALAGPILNLLLAQICLLLYKVHPDPLLRLFFLANLAIGLFNLLPAYPLDGGRMLHAALAKFLGVERARRIACFSGMLLGAGLLAYACWVFYSIHMVNVSFLLMGALLLVLAWRQRTSDLYTALKRSERKGKRLHHKPLAARQVAASEGLRATQLMSMLQKGQYMTAYVLDDAMQVRGVLDEKQILDGILRYGGTCTLKKILDRQTGARVN